MAKEVQNSRSGEIKQTAEDLDEFLNRVRSYLTHGFLVCFPLFPLCKSSHFNLDIFQVRRGAGVSNEEILSFAKLFNDELTLDNISRLVSIFNVLYLKAFDYLI